MRLHTLVPQQLWHAQQKLRFGPIELATRMTVVRLHDGSLWVHSPIQPTQELLAQLQSLGPVRQVVAPNRSHHLFFLPFVWAHPGAQGWIAPGLAEQHPSLAAYPSLGTPAPWHAELQPYPIHGLPQLNETVFFHPASGTLILTDLLFCIGPQPSALARGLARLLGIYGRVAMSRSMRLLVQDPAALAASVAPLLALPVQRLILAHDQIIEHDALAQWQQAWRWLVPPVTP